MKQPASFFSSLASLIILNVLIKPVWIFAIDRQVQNEIGTTEYGNYFSLLGLSIFFSFLLDWGLTIYFNRQLTSDPENFGKRTGNFLLIKIVFALLYAIVIILVALMAGITQWNVLFKIIGIQVLSSIFIFLRNIFTARQWFRTDAWFSVIDKIFVIIICAGFIYYPAIFGSISLNLFLDIQLMSTAIAVVVAFITLASRKIKFGIRRSSPGFNVIRSMFPFAVIVLLMSAHYRLDGFLLERLHPNGAYEAGLYAAAYRLADAANMIGFLFASFLLPYLTSIIHQKTLTNEVVIHSRHMLVIFSLFISITIFFEAPWIQYFLYPNSSRDSFVILQWCLPVLVFYAILQIYGTLLTAQAQLVQFARILFAGVAINILLNLWLIPEYGALGCCYSALVSHAACAILLLLYANKKLQVPWKASSFLIYLLIAVMIAGIYYFTLTKEINRWLIIDIAALLTFIVSLATKMLDFKLFQRNTITHNE